MAFLPVEAHMGLLDAARAQGWETETNREFDAIAATLKTAHAATLLYYYCHGKSDAPFSAAPVLTQRSEPG